MRITLLGALSVVGVIVLLVFIAKQLEDNPNQAGGTDGQAGNNDPNKPGQSGPF